MIAKATEQREKRQKERQEKKEQALNDDLKSYWEKKDAPAAGEEKKKTE